MPLDRAALRERAAQEIERRGWNEAQLESLQYAILLAAAEESLGVFPAAVIRGDEKHERTVFEDGWNAHGRDLLERQSLISRWLNRLDQVEQDAAISLILSDLVFIHRGDEGVELVANVNDTFVYAADAETIPSDQFRLVDELYRAHGYTGLVAWVAVRRQVKPLRTADFDGYAAAEATVLARLRG